MMFNLPFKLPKDWSVKTVEQLISDNVIEKPLDGNHGGIHPKTTDYVDSGVPFIMASDLENGRVNFNSCKFITEQQASTLKKGFSKAGDVLLSHKATIGRTAIVQDSENEFIVLTPQVTYYRIKDKRKLNNQYLKVYFDSRFFQSILGLWAGAGTTRAYLGITGQLKLPVIVPPINSQNSIAEYAECFNDKIELNRKINHTLEAMAQAIFKSWFVDFEPVKAKIVALEEGRDEQGVTRAAMSAISGKTDEELDQLLAEQPDNYTQLKATSKLFPTSMQDSKFGEIPEGWTVKQLDYIANYQNGLALQNFRPENEDEYLPVLKIAQLKKGFADGEERASINIKPECIVENGDVVFSWSGSLMVDIWCGGKVALNQHLFKVTSDEYPKWFYYYWTKHHLNEFQRIAADKAVTMGHIKREHLSDALCATPCPQIFNNASKIIGDLLGKAIEVRLENFTLKELRETILPKIFSGELSVDAAEFAEEN